MWRAGKAWHDTWLSTQNDGTTPMRPRVVVSWDDGFPRTDWVDPVETPPGGRWAKNLADFRPGLGSNTNAAVRVYLDRPAAVYAELWFGRDYATSGGYGYELATKCVP